MMQLLITLVFLAGYSMIVMENKIRINKAASALMAGVLAWTIFILYTPNTGQAVPELLEQFGNIAGILFFLLSAMTIVELVDMHDGFDFIVERVGSGNNRKLLWILSFIAFFLSALLDNLTTTIVMISIARKMIPEKNERWIFAGMIVIAANAGGAWSPMGDVTTTMLWIGNQITAQNIIMRLILPSLICLLVPLIAGTFMIRKASTKLQDTHQEEKRPVTRKERNIIFFCGLGLLLSVPFFKAVTGLPPYMGMLLALGIMWTVTEIIHRRKEEETKDIYSVAQALKNTDAPTILFFLGILLCISAMESTGILRDWAGYLTGHISREGTIAMLIGLFSAIVDNVPLVAAVQGMYDLTVYPTDHYFWEMIAFTTGTGGSVLIIGSAAGVAAMGMENIPFLWYLKRISLLALAGFFAGALIYYLQYAIFF